MFKPRITHTRNVKNENEKLTIGCTIQQVVITLTEKSHQNVNEKFANIFFEISQKKKNNQTNSSKKKFTKSK